MYAKLQTDGRTEGHSLNDISPPKGEMDEVQIVLYVSVFIVNVHYYLSSQIG